MKIIERNVQEIGKSLLVTLPKEWTKQVKLKKGSPVKIMLSDQGRLEIAPEFATPKEKREVTVPFDVYFERRFFREYFGGAERITFIFDKSPSPAVLQEFYVFLKRFMNVQIIEETEKKIVLKVFKIEELSIEECVRRIYYLSLNMIDELLAADNVNEKRMQELRDASTRFYYMLVMQVRRFLSEGKFIEENQISLLRAMDFRMVAERSRRIGNLAVLSGGIQHKKLLSFLQEIRRFYETTFNCFINKNSQRVLTLRKEGRDLREKYASLQKAFWRKRDIDLYQQHHNLARMLTYAREISGIVR